MKTKLNLFHSDIQIGILGFGSSTGEVVYRTKGTSLLTPASELRIIRPPEGQRSQASLLNGMKAISKYPFRTGSMRVALVMRCNSRDIPKVTIIQMFNFFLKLVTIKTNSMVYETCDCLQDKLAMV